MRSLSGELFGGCGESLGRCSLLGHQSQCAIHPAGYGAQANVGRSTLQLPPINDVDLTAGKTISLTERMKLSFYAQAFNVFNHSQWVGGFINDVAPIGYTGSQRSMLEPSSSSFNTPSAVFSSNPRTLQLALKFSF